MVGQGRTQKSHVVVVVAPAVPAAATANAAATEAVLILWDESMV